jgi:hypothetical protein
MAKYTNYKAQIGVNRGSGIAQASAFKGQEVQIFGQIADKYADIALKGLKEEGRKLGRETGLKVKFVDKEVLVTDENGEKTFMTVPVLPKVPDYLGYTAGINFEEVAYKRYELESETAVDKIINNAYSTAKEKNLKPVDIENELNEKRKIFIENLSPKFGELIDNHWERKFQKVGLGYLDIYNSKKREEADNIGKINDAKDQAAFLETLHTGESYSDNKLKISIQGQVDANVYTKNEGKELLAIAINNRNFARQLTSTYTAYISLPREEIDVADIATNLERNNNRKELLKLLQTGTVQRPNEVTLMLNGVPIKVTREDIDGMAQGDTTRFETAKKYLTKNKEISEELTKVKIRKNNFRRQFSDNISKRPDETFTYSNLSKTNFMSDLDLPANKAMMIASYNQHMITNDNSFNPITEVTGYNDLGLLAFIVNNHGVLPASAQRKYANAAVAYDSNIITEDVWDILTLPRNKSKAFDFGNDYNFNVKEDRILDRVDSYVTNGRGVKEAFLLARAIVERTTAKAGLRAAWFSQLDKGHFKSESDFFKSLEEKIESRIISFQDQNLDITSDYKTSYGTYFYSQIWQGVLKDMESAATQITTNEEMGRVVDRVLSKSGFHDKFGISRLSVGVGLKIRDDGSFDENAIVALPIERLYPQLKSKNAINKLDTIIANMFRDRPVYHKEDLKVIGGTNDRLLKVNGGKIALAPVNLNHLHNPNLRDDINSERIKNIDYYLVYYDKANDKIVYPRDKSGDYYIIGREEINEVQRLIELEQ